MESEPKREGSINQGHLSGFPPDKGKVVILTIEDLYKGSVLPTPKDEQQVQLETTHPNGQVRM